MRLSRFSAIAVLIGLAVASCGDDDDEATPATESAATESSATESSATESSVDAAATTVAATDGQPSDDEWQTILDAADDEGEVTVYGVFNVATSTGLEKAFEAAYPEIDLTYANFQVAEIEARLEAEFASGVVVDVVESGTLAGAVALSSSGRLVEPVGPAFDDPAYPRDELMPTDDWFTMAGSVNGWAWNTDLVPEGIDSWDDFLTLEPGLIALPDVSLSRNFVDYFNAVEDEAGAGWLDELAAADLEPAIYPGSGAMAAALASGEVGAAPNISAPPILDEKKKGSPVDFRTYPGAVITPVYAGIVEGSPHPNAAQVYANWLVSADGQQVFVDNSFATFLQSVSNPMNPEGDVRLPETVTDEQAAAFQQRWDDLFG